MNHDAIFKLNPTVVIINGDTAYDADGNEVTYDIAAIQAYITANEYKDKRAAEYPPMSDYLDAIVKGDTQQQEAYIAACLAVKAKYPK
jgi:hypothetical protein